MYFVLGSLCLQSQVVFCAICNFLKSDCTFPSLRPGTVRRKVTGMHKLRELIYRSKSSYAILAKCYVNISGALNVVQTDNLDFVHVIDGYKLGFDKISHL